jgi:hypothetical protein
MKKIFGVLLMSAAALGTSGFASASSPEAKASFNGAKDIAQAEYKIAVAKCDSLTGNPKEVCVAEAKAARTTLESNASAQYKNTLSNRTNSAKAIVDAHYDVEKAKCGSKNGNEKDVCIKIADANKIAGIANATADKKVAEVRADARRDKVAAGYKVELEKCEAFAGATKDNCVSTTKMQFGK